MCKEQFFKHSCSTRVLRPRGIVELKHIFVHEYRLGICAIDHYFLCSVSEVLGNRSFENRHFCQCKVCIITATLTRPRVMTQVLELT